MEGFCPFGKYSNSLFLLYVVDPLLSHCACSSTTSNALLFSFALIIASGDCLLTIVITAYTHSSSMRTTDTLFSHYCTISCIYWVTDITYDRETLERDKNTLTPFIVRTNAEKKGYLSFVLPLLYNSTFSLIIDLDTMKGRLPSSDWIDNAVALINKNTSAIPTCGSLRGVAEGCMLVRSIDLRYIWSHTSFRRQEAQAMTVFSHILRCIWKYTLINTHLPYPSSNSATSSFVEHNCEQVYDVKYFNCHANYSNDGTTGIVISQFKRTILDQQLAALGNSDSSITQIIILQGLQYQNYESVLKKWPNVRHIWLTNWDSPFFFRFLVPLIMTTYYTYLIDDDIVFGNRTVSSMNRLSSKYDALVGVNGRVVQSLEYTNPSFIQEVIRTNSEERSRVDFLCNTFGAQREHMKVFWRYRPYTQRNGEDIHFSMSNAIECDRQSRVILECEKKMREYGRDNVAISKQGFHFPIRKLILRAWYYRGVTFIKQQQLNDTLPHGLIMESWNSSREGYYFSVVSLRR